VHQYLGEEQLVSGLPLLMMPENFSRRPGAKQEKLKLKRWFPKLRVVKHFHPGRPLEAQWIHASTHFNLNCRVWPASTFDNNGRKLSMLDFLRGGVRCRLLSLSVCNSANNRFSDTPYWLGLAELLLLGGAQSLVLSRWQLDETASQIFVDFYRYCHAGFSMDEALHLARLQFQQQQVKRSQALALGSHPYFWAGIIYVGRPGRYLYPKPVGRTQLLSSLILTLTMIYLLLQSGTRKRM
jgi:CHAT domain-containing protein